MHYLARNRSPRAVGFIWFFCVAIYFLMLSAFISVDMSRIIVTHTEVTLAAESAALAGAAQATLEAGQYSLNVPNATAAASDTFAAEEANLAMRYATIPSAPVPDVFSSSTLNPNTVTVTVYYHVNGLIFAGFFGQTAPQYSATATAYLCLPNLGITDYYNGFTNEYINGDCIPPQS